MTIEAPQPIQGDPIWAHAQLCAEAALDRKGWDLVILDLRGITSLADYFVLVSGRSDTQVRAIAEEIEERSRRAGKRPLSVEGSRNGQWILLDFGDVVAHVFYGPMREHYDLERLWSRARRCELSDPVSSPR